MISPVLLVWPGLGDPPPVVVDSERQGRVTVRPRLDAADLQHHQGLVTGQMFDQDAAFELKGALAAFLNREGRWFFNGHMIRPLVDGMAPYRPLPRPRRADFDLTPLAPHPVFAGIDMSSLVANRGVAGFYGRGANPPPEGAVVITGLGPARVPVDWVWLRPGGGRVFSHAGNDLGQAGREHGLSPVLWARTIEWAAGGPCLCD